MGVLGRFGLNQRFHSASVLVVAACAVCWGCMHAAPASRSVPSGGEDPFAQAHDESRETVLIKPQGDSAEYDISPAVFDTALIKVDAPSTTGAVVEVLIKGSFPDGCLELNALDQDPTNDGQRVQLTMRKPMDAICTQVVRPYRFFFTLDRRFRPGHYQLTVNGRSFVFNVAAADTQMQ